MVKPGNERVKIHADGSKERWRDVVGYEGLYRISDWGRLKSLGRWRLHGRNKSFRFFLSGRIKKPTLSEGRFLVNLCKDGKNKTRNAAHLVLETFVGPCPPGMECCHYDRNPQNNRLDNLRWDTHASNEGDKRRHGTDNSGARCGSAKLTEDDVREIRRIYATGAFSLMKLAKAYGVALGTIQPIIYRKTWKHVV